MLLSLSLIFIFGLFCALICNKIKLPSLIGFLIVGIVLNALNLIDSKIINISTELRQIALIIILTRAGLTLNIQDLKKIGRPAILMCFIPAAFEITAVSVLGYYLFNLPFAEALLLGSVLAAVSPAVVVPRMIKMIEGGQGVKKAIPQLIMAGASVDDIFVIVAFTTFTKLSTGGSFNVLSVLNIPLAIILGAIAGIITAFMLVKFFKAVHIRDSIKVIIFLSIAFLLVALESALKNIIGFSGLIAVMTCGMVILAKYDILAKRLSQKFSKLWVAAEILLFVLVGAAVDITVIYDNLLNGILLITGALIIRMCGVLVCLIKTNLNSREKLFCSISYTPKATVQAAIGGIPLALGIASGNLILSLAVLSIVLTAPIGAYLMDLTNKRLIK
jgi:NhaP-type Na+/H+ or K+/H+ antiporter